MKDASALLLNFQSASLHSSHVPRLFPPTRKTFFVKFYRQTNIFQSNPLEFKRKKKYCEIMKLQIVAAAVKTQNTANGFLNIIKNFQVYEE